MGKIGQSDLGNNPKGESEGTLYPNANGDKAFRFTFGQQSRLSDSAPQEARDREAERIRNVEDQAESLSLKLVALAEGSQRVSPFTPEEIEWLFFAAMDFHFSAYGGNCPILEEIDPDDGLSSYDLYAWMGEEYPDPEQQRHFVELLRRNSGGPRRLWVSDFLGDDGAGTSYGAIVSQLSLEALRDQVFVPKLLEHLKLTTDKSGSWISEQTRRMLSEPFYFGSVGKFTMSGFSQFTLPQRPLPPTWRQAILDFVAENYGHIDYWGQDDGSQDGGSQDDSSMFLCWYDKKLPDTVSNGDKFFYVFASKTFLEISVPCAFFDEAELQSFLEHISIWGRGKMGQAFTLRNNFPTLFVEQHPDRAIVMIDQLIKAARTYEAKNSGEELPTNIFPNRRATVD